jgi:excisionase family DNA binding protein
MTDDVDDQPEFLSVSHIAGRLNISSQAVRDWIEEGILPGIRVRKVWRVRREDFEQLLASLEAGRAAPAGIWEERTPRRRLRDLEENTRR